MPSKQKKPESLDTPVLGTGANGDVKDPAAGAPVQPVPADVPVTPVAKAPKEEKETEK